ncbi:MAG TPA: F0F1 ATP synthase subunit C [Nitrospiraceae bacterium]|nr:F0F1 ATP synthase subunit C [Nitrospiraceae bacterium]
MRMKRMLMDLVILNGVVILGAGLVGLLLGVTPEVAFSASGSSLSDEVIRWGFLSAALAVGMGAIAAGIAVGLVGAAAMGTIGERPELVGRTLIFVGLAEGIAIYGLIVAIMILGRL